MEGKCPCEIAQWSYEVLPFTTSAFSPLKDCVFWGTTENWNILYYSIWVSNASTLWKLLIWYHNYACNMKLLSTVILHSKWNLYWCNKMYFNSITITLSYSLMVCTVNKNKIQPGKAQLTGLVYYNIRS